MKEITKAKIVLVFVNILFASALVVTKGLVEVFPMYLLTSLRFFVAAICVAILYHNKLKNINKDVILCGALIGVFYILGCILQTLGIKYTTAGRTSFLTALYSLIVPFLAWGFMKVKPTANKFIAAIIGIVGVGFIVLTEKFEINSGDLFTLGAVASFAMYIVLTSMLVKKFDPEVLNIFLFLLAAVVTLILSLTLEKSVKVPMDILPFLGIFYLGLMCSAIPLVLQSKAQKIVDPSFVGIMIGPQAMFTTIFSVIFFHEPITIKNLIGFALIFIAVLIGAK